MADKKSLDVAFRLLNDLSAKLDRLNRDVRKLKDALNTHDNWPSSARGLIGRNVSILLRNDDIVNGKLLWFDRYNLCVEDSDNRPYIISKGGILWITSG